MSTRVMFWVSPIALVRLSTLGVSIIEFVRSTRTRSSATAGTSRNGTSENL